jgi:UMF1 family MFS transporter
VAARVSTQRQRRAWYAYDWANSAFATSILAVFLGPYLTDVAEAAAGTDGFLHPLGVPIRAEAYYAFLVSASALLQVLAMPVVGALADRSGRHRLALGACAYTGALATMALWFVSGRAYALGGALFLVASVAFACSIVVYNAFLPDLASPDERDAVSARGWATGYLGGGLLLAAHLVLFTLADSERIALDSSQAVRLSLLSSGIWWALFTLVAQRGLPPAPRGAAQRRATIGGGLAQLRATLRGLVAARLTLLFLVAYLLYNDGVQTVISQAAVFADRELDLGRGIVAGAILLVQFVAVLGALALGALARRFGAKRVVLASLLVWIGVLSYAFVLPAGRVAPFLALAALIGLVLGGTQALSRSLFSHLILPGREAEYFSVYELSERGTSWLGPLLFGLAVQVTGDYRVAILSLVVFFALGFALLSVTDLRRAVVEAGNPLPRRL